MLFIQWAATLELYIRDKRTPIQEGEDYIAIMSWTMAVCSIIMGIVLRSSVTNNLLSTQRWVIIALGAMFIVTSNKMPKYKQNRWFGLRIKYTLNDKENWFKTHRLAAKVGVVGGLIIMGLALLPNLQLAYILMLIVMPFIIFIPVGYSAYLNRTRKTETDKEE